MRRSVAFAAPISSHRLVTPVGVCALADEQLVDEPNAVGIENITFAIPSHFLDLSGPHHLLNAAAKTSTRQIATEMEASAG
jgi:hypothetical protein